MVLVPAAAALISIGGPVFVAGVVLIAGLMLWEWCGLVVAAEAHTRARAVIIGAALLVLAAGLLLGLSYALAAVFVAAAAVVGVARLSGIGTGSWLGVALVASLVPVIALIWMRIESPLGLETVVYVITSVVLVDIGAYAAGRTIGGPKLMPRVSPSKTWAGLIGGIAAAVLLAIAVAAWLPDARWLVLVPVAILIALLAQTGDLLESAVKRRFNIKDSGHLIPGHGGILDRVDGQVTVLPTMALAIAVSGRSVLQW